MKPKELAAQLRKPEGQKGIETGKMMNDGNKYMYSLVYSLLDLKEGDSVLEMGFGNGKFISGLFEKNSRIQYTGIDFSETMVREAMENNASLIKERKVEIKQANISDIPYPHEKFDTLFTINTLYFWENPPADIKEIKRVLKKGGKVFICIRPRHLVQDMEFTKYGFTLYEAEDVKKLLEEAGFSDVEWKSQDEPEFEVQGQKVRFKSVCIWAIK